MPRPKPWVSNSFPSNRRGEFLRSERIVGRLEFFGGLQAAFSSEYSSWTPPRTEPKAQNFSLLK